MPQSELPKLTINGQTYTLPDDPDKFIDVTIPSAVEDPDAYFNESFNYADRFDRDFSDEVFFKFKLGDKYTYRLARFPGSTKFLPQKAEEVKSLSFIDIDGKKYEGQALWLNDEHDSKAKLAAVDIEFGYFRIEQNDPSIPGDDEEIWVDGGWTKGVFLSDERDKIEKIVKRKANLKDNELDETNWPALKQRLWHGLKDKAMFVEPKLQWVGDQVKINLYVTPPAKDLGVDIEFWDPEEGKKTILPKGQETVLATKIRGHFKKPLTNKSVVKDLEKLAKTFRGDPDYMIKAEGPVFREDGILSLKVQARPVYKSVMLYIDRRDADGNSVSQTQVNPAKLGIDIHYPLNEENQEKNRQEIIAYYEQLGYLAYIDTDKSLPVRKEILPVAIRISPAPTVFKFTINLGPAPSKVEKMFKDKKLDQFTGGSIQDGIRKLRTWYETNGYVLAQCDNGADIKVNIENGTLKVLCKARKFEGYQMFLAGNLEESTRKFLEDNGGIEKFKSTFPLNKGDYYNRNDLRRFVDFINSNYPLHVEYNEKFNLETGEVAVALQISDSGAEIATFGVNPSVDTLGLGTSVDGNYRLENGHQITGEAGVGGYPEYTTISTSAGYVMPWINKSGTSIDLHTGADWMLTNPYSSQSVGFGVVQPIGKAASPWSYLGGFDLERLAESGELWNKPYVGVRYLADGTTVTIKTGPRVSFNGAIYVEIEIHVSNKKYLTKNGRLYIKSDAVAGVRVGQQPADLASLSFTPVGPSLSPVALYATAKTGILYKIINQPGMALGLGLGMGATTRNFITGTPALGFGPAVDFESPIISVYVMGGPGIGAGGWAVF